MSIYTKSIIDDFSNNFDLSQFSQQIRQDPLLQSIYQGTNMNGDQIDIVFSQSLTTPQSDQLNQLILNHTPTQLFQNHSFFQINPQINYTENTQYTRLAIFTYNKINIVKINLIANITNPSLSYDIKIIDFTNSSNVIASKTSISNIDLEIIDLGEIENLPQDYAVFELWAKINGQPNENDRLYVDQITIYYE